MENKSDNELIAEFMGVQVYGSWQEMDAVPIENLGIWAMRDKLEYDKNWKYLMEVVEKIKDFRQTGMDTPNTERISHSHVHVYIAATGFQAKWYCSILGKLVKLKITEGGFHQYEDIEIPHITIRADEVNNPFIPTYKAVVDFIKWYNNSQSIKRETKDSTV
jgi:hypothetical protein